MKLSAVPQHLIKLRAPKTYLLGMGVAQIGANKPRILEVAALQARSP